MSGKKRELTQKQIKKLADLLVDTNKNVYTVCKQEFGIGADDSVFDQLAKVGGIFKCEQCDRWMGLDLRDPDMASNLCLSCVEEMDADT